MLEKKCFLISFPLGVFEKADSPPTFVRKKGRWTQLENADGMARASDRGAARARDDEGVLSTKASHKG